MAVLGHKGRLSAGFVLDLRKEPRVGKALVFFHGSRWPEGGLVVAGPTMSASAWLGAMIW